MDKQQNWNGYYEQGIDYRQISDADVAHIVSELSGDTKNLIDIGCGNGELARQFQRVGFEVMGVDLSDVAVAKARELSPEEITFKTLDFETDDVSDIGTFDVVTMKLVFAFMQNKGEVITKIKNLLNPGGALVIITPVITKPSGASEKLHRISVDDNITMEIENFGFELKSRTAVPLSDFHELVTYVFYKV